MTSAKTFARFDLLFALAILLGIVLALAEYWVPGHAAYAPTPTKTPQPATTASLLNPATDTPPPVSETPTAAALAPATRAPAIPSAADYAATLPPTARPNLMATATQSATRPPAASPTASETPLAQPTSRPAEPVFTATPDLLHTHVSSPTPGATSCPTSTPTVTETVAPHAYFYAHDKRPSAIPMASFYGCSMALLAIRISGRAKHCPHQVGVVFVFLAVGRQHDAKARRDDLQVHHAWLRTAEAAIGPFHLFD